MASDSTNRNTESEDLFEEYLNTHGYSGWSHEQPFEDKRKKLDYCLSFGGSPHFFEVKEFDTPRPPGFGAVDLYGPIREKINQATRQFREYKEFSCSVVLANHKSSFVLLGEPWTVFGAMFGDVGFRIQDGVGPNAEKTVAQVFTRGGKMVNDKRQEPQNTTVSSIIVLDTYPLRQKRIDAAIKLRERELGRSARVEEKLALYEATPDTSDLRRVRLMVHENPFARIPLRRDVFDGPFDERWGGDGECIRRVYVGSIAARFADALGES